MTDPRRTSGNTTLNERLMSVDWLRAVIVPPADMFARIRKALMTLNLAIGAALFYLFFESATSLSSAEMLACAALVWLSCLWVHAYRNVNISPVWDVGVALSLLAVGLSIQHPLSPSGLLYLSMLYGGLCYRSFTLSTRTVVGSAFLYSVVHAASFGYTVGFITDVSDPLIGLLQTPGLAISAGATHMLARLISARQHMLRSVPLSEIDVVDAARNPDELRAFQTTMLAIERITGPRYRANTRVLIGNGQRMTVVAGGQATSIDVQSILSQSQRTLMSGEPAQAANNELPRLIANLDFSRDTSAITLAPLSTETSLCGLIAVGGSAPLHAGVIDGLRAVAAQTSLVLETLDLTANLRQREAGFRKLIQTSSDLILVVDPQMHITDLAPTAGRILGYEPRDLIGSSLARLIHPEDLQIAIEGIATVTQAKKSSPPMHWRIGRRDGGWLHVETVGNNLLDDPNVAGIVLTARDISERKELEANILHKLFHDALTGLPNRTLFMDRLESALATSRARGLSVSVLFLDLDRFKVINDSLGHDAGNQLLINIARQLQECVRPSDTVARLSGDEFAVLVDGTRGADTPLDVAQRILYRLREAIRIDGYDVVISTSIGVAVSSETGPEESASDLLRNADLAMYEAKNRGRGNYAVFNPLMNARAVNRLAMETELRSAISNSEFQVYYQPLVQLRTGKVDEVEALVRWRHPTRGLLLPDSFIALAEETGLIEPIGQWVLEEACRQGQIWEKERPGAPPLNLNVNLSVRQFQQASLVNDVSRALRQARIAPHQLTLEITESVALEDAEAAVATMKELKSLGVRLAIDDFGTGFSALSYLKRFPVDTLKIDRSFVEGLNYDHGDVAIVRAVIAFAKTMNLNVTAEGVETPDQIRHLMALGCDRGQGYYFATPLPGVELSLDSHYGANALTIVDSPRTSIVRAIHRSA